MLLGLSSFLLQHKVVNFDDSKMTMSKRFTYFLISLVVTASVLVSQSFGLLQNLELKVFDQFLLHRPIIKQDAPIVIIGETEADIRRFGHPLSDQVVADAIQKLENADAKVIGIDKYRDVPVAPGSDALKVAFEKYQNLVWIFFINPNPTDFIPAPAALNANPERTGFNNSLEDSDGILRRGLLFLDDKDTSYYSFPLLISLHYLASENIAAKSDDAGNFSLNSISLKPLTATFGAYNHIDAGSYQIPLTFPALSNAFPIFTLSELFDDKIPAETLQEKIVLLGGMAPSLGDYKFLPNEIRKFGIEYHGYVISELLNIAHHKQKPLQDWTQWQEMLWLFGWCLLGALTGSRKKQLLLCIFIEASVLLLSSYSLFRFGWWLPFVAPALAWSLALGMSVLLFFTKEKTERQELMTLFSSHVSPDVARRLWESREQFFQGGHIQPDYVVATVLFTDLTNFTTISEKLEPLVLMEWLSEYMEEMSAIVMQHNGIVNKYIGDAIMAVFGVPVKRETDAEMAQDALNAVQCAKAFNQKLCELNEKWQMLGLPTVTMRTGIHTGSLVAGTFGGVSRTEYTVIGDIVNVASRLESFDKNIAVPTAENPNRILIGKSTFQYVQNVVQVAKIAEVALKGKTELLTIYHVSTSNNLNL